MLYSTSLCLSLGLTAAGVYGAPQVPNTNTPPEEAPPRQSAPWQLPPQRSYGEPGVNATYDYVIIGVPLATWKINVIGGGTAGLTVATRLAENATLRIAVIEAGGFYEIDNGNLSTVPAYWLAGTETPSNATILPTDWGYVTTPQEWAEDVGDDSYTFEAMLPFFDKSPYNAPSPSNASAADNLQDPEAFDPNGGPLRVSQGNYLDPFGPVAIEGFTALGQEAIPGLQSGELIGQGYVEFTIDPATGKRSSSESSFLQNAVTKQNGLKLYNNTMAERILFDYNATGSTATGVLISSEGSEPYVLTATREVILSAGAFRSPQLLMVSGVGPRAAVQDNDIPLINNLAGVGDNLEDHPFFATSFAVKVPTIATEDALAQYLESRNGPLSISSPGPIGWEKLPQPYRDELPIEYQVVLDNSFPADWPEVEWLPVSMNVGPQALPYQPAAMATALVAPLSRGNVTIASASMSDNPIINPAWLTNSVDQQLAIQTFKRHREFWRASTAANITLGEELLPGAAVQTDEQILAFIMASLSPIWHAAGTCKMGKPTDQYAVVDSRFKVMGIKKLRVVDASVMPRLVPGHPQATIYALAEKLADLLVNGTVDENAGGRGLGFEVVPAASGNGTTSVGSE
ncbi:MAG: hypothetical protein Q9174_006414 [Haloplaca sp. 1 TL-2023]